MGSGRAGGLREQLYLFSLGLSVRLNARCSVNAAEKGGRRSARNVRVVTTFKSADESEEAFKKKKKKTQTRKIRN